MKLFRLVRDTDFSGVSGTGVVAEGVVFSDGTCAMRWRSATASTAIYSSVEDLEAIHGHGGSTRVVFQDPFEMAYDAAEGIRDAVERGEF